MKDFTFTSWAILFIACAAVWRSSDKQIIEIKSRLDKLEYRSNNNADMHL